MTQEERWMAKYNEVVVFIKNNHRDPSRHRIEEHLMLNFIKHDRKLINQGEMKPERVEMFKEVMELGEKYKRINQYQQF